MPGSFPGERTRDPYRVWVSEIMLQQTVVAAVVPYFERFLARFPNVTALADAPEEHVLRLWEGLGYYRRPGNCTARARVIRDEHRGRFPRDAAAVRLCRASDVYTAGAILSIAFGPAAAYPGSEHDSTAGAADGLLRLTRIRQPANACSGTPPNGYCPAKTQAGSTRR